MGAVIAAVVSAVASSFTSFSVGSFLSQRLLGGVLSFGLSSLSRNIAGKPKATIRDNLDGGLTQTVRQAITERRVIYGTARVGGTMVALGTDDSQKFLYMAVALASHEVTAIDTVYLNDEPIFTDMIDGGTKMVIAGRYANLVRIEKILGSDTQAANSNMIAEIQDWTSAHRLQAIAYVYIRMEYNRTAFSGGIPNVSAIVRGKQVYDPRDTVTKFSENPALCVRDYLTDTRYGRNVAPSELEEDFFMAAANLCDEFVTTNDITATVSAVNDAGDYFDLSGGVCPFQTGDRVQIETTGTLPSFLSAATDYYAIVSREKAFVDDTAPTTRVRLANDYFAALNQSAQSFTGTGSGTITLTKKAEPRYSCNGVVTMDRQPSDILTELVAAMAGRLVYIGGTWRVFAGGWISSSFTFNDADFVAPIVTQTRRSRRDRYNAIKGQFTAPQNFFQPTDYPAIRIAAYKTQDNNEEIFGQLNLAFTTRSQTAQRIARIALERNRRELSVQIETNLRGLTVQAGDIVSLTHPRFGWENKTFEVIDWRLSTIEQDGAPLMTVQMGLTEIDADVFAFNAATDESALSPAPRTNLPSGLRVNAPTGLAVASGDSNMYVRQDGTVFSRLRVTWTPQDGPIDRYEIQYRETIASTWQRPVFVAADQSDIFLLEAQEGITYEIRLRAIGALGTASAWVVVTHTVSGKTLPPANVEQFSANANGAVVYFAWKEVTDRDIAGYEIRYDTVGASNWDNAVTVKIAERGNELTTAAVPPGSWTFFIKALDTSGNVSVTAATANAVVQNSNIVIASNNNTDWLGVRTNLIVHAPTNRLVPIDQIAANVNGFATFDQFLQSPFSVYRYESNELDIGSVLSSPARIWLDVAGGINSFTTNTGALFDYDSQLATRDTGLYGPFQPWDIGELDGFQAAKAQFDLATDRGVGYFSRARIVIDAPPRTETRSVSVTSGSTAITFNNAFLTPPLVRVSLGDSSNNIAAQSSVTTTGFTILLNTPAGSPASGVVIFDATGV